MFDTSKSGHPENGSKFSASEPMRLPWFYQKSKVPLYNCLMYEVASVPFGCHEGQDSGRFQFVLLSNRWKVHVFTIPKMAPTQLPGDFWFGRPMFAGTVPGHLLKSNPKGWRAPSSTWTTIFIVRWKIWCNNKPPKGNRLCNQAAIELFGTLHLRTHGRNPCPLQNYVLWLVDQIFLGILAQSLLKGKQTTKFWHAKNRHPPRPMQIWSTFLQFFESSVRKVSLQDAIQKPPINNSSPKKKNNHQFLGAIFWPSLVQLEFFQTRQ